MYKQEKVETHIESVKFTGSGDKPALQVTFYVTPCTFELLYEIDDRSAKALFHKEGGEYRPVAELDDVTLKLGELGAHNIEWFPHDQEGSDGAGQLTAACQITKVECSKLFKDKPDWSLIWHALIPSDSHSLELCRKYYKRHAFITLLKTQDDLISDSDGTPGPIILDDTTVESPKFMYCELCKAKATYLGSDSLAWCASHVHGALPDVKVRQIKYVEMATDSRA